MIDDKFISERETLKYFGDSKGLFEILTQDFGKVIVGDGELRFVYKTMLRGEKTVTIELKRSVKLEK
jgi:hypothetical protein